MRGIPTSQIRAPLFAPVAIASFVPTCAASLACVAWFEMHGLLRYAVLAAALVLVVVGVRLTWRVAKRETERLR
jgi:ABC-type Na+ efflux pump permease subunit